MVSYDFIVQLKRISTNSENVKKINKKATTKVLQRYRTN